MKQTLLLLTLFILAQIMGILVLSSYIDFPASQNAGQTVLVPDIYPVTPLQVENESYSFISIFIAILIGTSLVLLLLKYGKVLVFKFWFLFSISIALTFALWPFLNSAFENVLVVFIIAVILSGWRVFKPNLYIHNVTEIFLYGGLAAIFVPVLNITSAIILLVLIAIYDYIMVFKLKHMVTLAQGQMQHQMVAGLLVNNAVGKKTKKKTTGKFTPSMLGGGDVAFPLFFAGAIMKFTGSAFSAYPIIIGATLGLIVLFATAKEKQFYPAMPFITVGCLLGLGFVLLI